MIIFKFKDLLLLFLKLLCEWDCGKLSELPWFLLISDCSTAIRFASWEDLQCWCAHKGHIGVSQRLRCPWSYRHLLCKTRQKSEAASCLKGPFDGSILSVAREIPTFGHILPFGPSTTTILMLVIFTVLLHQVLPDVICNSKLGHVQIFLHVFYLWIRLLG